MRSMRPGFQTSLAQFSWRWAQIDPRLKASRTSSAALQLRFAQNDISKMNKRDEKLWQGIDRAAQDALSVRNYRSASFAQELAQRGVDAGELVAADRNQREIKEVWIPGVEIFARKVYPQRHVGASRNLCGATKGFSRGLACGRSNGRLRACLGTRRKVSTCIHRVFRKTALPRSGCAARSSMNRKTIR